MRSVILAAIAVSTGALKCWTYQKCFKSDAGKMSQEEFDGEATECGGDGPSVNSFTPCVFTCAAGETTCYNNQVDEGYGDDCTLGGGSSNYGIQTGGCMADGACDKLNCCTEDACN